MIPVRIEGYVMILMPVLLGMLLLIIPVLNHKGERAASRRPWAIAVVCLSVIMIGSLWIEGQQSPTGCASAIDEPSIKMQSAIAGSFVASAPIQARPADDARLAQAWDFVMPPMSWWPLPLWR